MLAFAVLLLASFDEARGYTPGTSSPAAVSGFVVNRLDRRDVLVFYNCAYSASQNFAANMAWTGNVTTGVPGTTSAAFKDDVLRRINFYRALVGLPGDIVLNATKSAKCQEAALMFSANDDIDHFPTNAWTWYTAIAAEAAANSNLALGNHGPDAINAYMEDFGPDNQLVGHRRWLLYSRAQEMGTGDVPENGAFNSANAVWVIGNFKPAPTPQFVAWPNRGFIPHTLIPARWSLSYPGATFTSASVTMTQGGSPVTTTIVSNGTTNVGDNTIVWEPAGLPASVTNDVTYDITVSGITGAGVPSSYSYSVTLFNPDLLGDSVTINGTNSPFTTGSGYTFNTITQADQYELKVSQGSTAAWTEGAEDAPTPQITDQTTGGYGLRQTGLKRTGAKAFNLAFPDFEDQSFVVTRDIVPSPSSQLQWYDRGRFATTTTTLDVEISTDNGTTWTGVFSRSGVGLNSALWDASWISRSVSLAAYAGQLIQVRFIMKQNGGSISISTSGNHGFFIDDITVTNATELVNTTATPLAGAATSFTLNGTTAGAALVAGTSYYMRVRPNVGLRWYGYGAMKTVTPQAPVGYAGWIATQYPTVTGGSLADHDQDGIRNGVEYAFSLNPTAFTPGASLPQPVLAGGNLTLSYTPPVGVTGVTYGAEWSENLQDWFPVTDTGTGGQRVFSVSTAGKTSLFLRHKIAVAP